MGKGSSGSTNTTTTSSQPPPQVLAAYQTAIDRASSAANTPYQPYQGQIVAPFSDLQNQGFENAYAPSDVYNQTAPYAANYYQQGASGLQGGTGIAGNVYQTAMGQYGYATDPYAAAARIAGNVYQDATGQYANVPGDLNEASRWGGSALTQAAMGYQSAADPLYAAAQQAGGFYGQAGQQYANSPQALDRAAGIAGSMYGNAPSALDAAGQQAQGTWGQAAGAYGASNTPLWANTQQYNPSTLSQYFNPYLQNVVNATQAQFNNQNAIQQQGVIGNAAAQGAWGGDRSAVAQALLAGQQQTAQAPVLAGLYNQGFQQAQQELNTQQAAQLGANEAQGWLASQTGAGLAGIGSAQANLGQARTQAQMQAAQGIAGLGQAQTAAQQAAAAGQLNVGQQYGALGQAQTQAALQRAQGLGTTGQQYAAIQQANAAARMQQAQGMAGIAGGVGNLGQGLTAAQLQQAAGIAGIGQGMGNLANQQAQTYAGLGAGMGQLGVQGANVGLSQLNTLQSLGAQQQQLAQAQLNVPYQQYIAAQAYPFQTSQFYTNAAEGLGGLAGGTSKTTSPGPSPISGIGGLLGGAASLAGLFINRGGRIPGEYASGGKIDPIHGSLPHNPDIGAKPMRIGVYNIPHRLKMATGGLAGVAASQKQQQSLLPEIPDLSLSIVPVPTAMDRTGLHLGPPTPPTVPSTTAPNTTSTLGTELGGLMKNDAFTGLFKKSDFGGGSDWGSGAMPGYDYNAPSNTDTWGGGGDFGAAYSDPGFYERGGIIGRPVRGYDDGGDVDDDVPDIPRLSSPPPGQQYNSRGEPINVAMSSQERANEQKVYAQLKTNPSAVWQRNPAARGAIAAGDEAPPPPAPTGVAGKPADAVEPPTMVGLDPGVRKFVQRESGGQPYVGYTSPETLKAQGHVTDLRDAPLTETGRPDWKGDMGPQGISTAFGPAQITGTNWDRIAPKLGVTDWRNPGEYAKVVNALHDEGGDAPWTTQAGLGPVGGRRGTQLAQNYTTGAMTDAPSGISGHVPAAVAAEPEKLSGWKKMEAAGVNPWLMLAQGFFGAAAGRSPQAFQNFGAGFADATKTAIELMGPKSQLERAQAQKIQFENQMIRDTNQQISVERSADTLNNHINQISKGMRAVTPTLINSQDPGQTAAPDSSLQTPNEIPLEGPGAPTGAVPAENTSSPGVGKIPPLDPQEQTQQHIYEQNDATLAQDQDRLRYATVTSIEQRNQNLAAVARIQETRNANLRESPAYKHAITGGAPLAEAPGRGAIATAEETGKNAPLVSRAQQIANIDLAKAWNEPKLRPAGEQLVNPSQLPGAPNYSGTGVGRPPVAPDTTTPPPGATAPNQPGVLLGAPTPIQKEIFDRTDAAAMKEVTDLQTAATGAREQVANARAVLDLMPRVKMGWGADMVNEAAQIMSSLGVPQESVRSFLNTDPAAAGALNKMFLKFSADAVRTMGAREPGSVITLFARAYPNLETHPHAAELMTNALMMQAKWKADMADAATNWLKQQRANVGPNGENYHGMLEFNKEFAKTNDPALYWRAASAISGEGRIAWGQAKTAEQKDAIRSLIPSGSTYIDPDGDIRTKR